MESDPLRSVRNAYYLGLYTDVAKEVQQLDKSNKEALAWGEVYLARSRVAINPSSFQIPSNAPTPLQAVKQLATYLTTDDDQKELVLDTLKDWLSTPELAKDVTVQLMASEIYLQHGMLKEALTVVVNDNENLEKLSMCILIYLRLERIDLAAKCLKAMQDLDDDDTLTALASVWLGISSGDPSRLSEASVCLSELQEKFGSTVVVLNAQSACEIHSRNYTQGFAYAKQARDLSIKQGQRVPAETMLNSIVCLQHLRKGDEVIQRVVAELKSSHPHHPWFKRQEQMNSLFEKCSEGYKNKK